jgi:predicted DNA-binding antitoxin AbrB/MazE fold protein
MTKTFPAVYEAGVLRPLEPLALSERQRVSVSISDSLDDYESPWLDHECMAAIDAAQEAEPTLD